MAAWRDLHVNGRATSRMCQGYLVNLFTLVGCYLGAVLRMSAQAQDVSRVVQGVPAAKSRRKSVPRRFLNFRQTQSHRFGCTISPIF
jgi:hypothetical protein